MQDGQLLWNGEVDGARRSPAETLLFAAATLRSAASARRGFYPPTLLVSDAALVRVWVLQWVLESAPALVPESDMAGKAQMWAKNCMCLTHHTSSWAWRPIHFLGANIAPC